MNFGTMQFRQRPVTALRLSCDVTLSAPSGDVVARDGDWLVWDECGVMNAYRHEHFIRTFEPHDDEAREEWSAFRLLGKQAG